MENLYLKYSEELPCPLPSISILKNEYINGWKQNIIYEADILKNILENKYSLYINDIIIKLLKKIVNIIEQYRYLFLEQYLYYLDNEDKFYININDNINIFKIKFLKETYNKILLLIDNICSYNKILALLHNNNLQVLEVKNFSKSENSKINDELFYKLSSDIEKIEKEFEKYKNIFNFKNNQNILYPKEEEFNKLFEEFNININNNNLEIEKKIKKCPPKIIKEKLLSSKTDIVIKKNNPNLDEIYKISKFIKDIKDNIKDIKEKQKNYCISSIFDQKNFQDEFKSIKDSTIKINDDIYAQKNEIKEFNNKYKTLINNIENYHNEFLNIKKTNDCLNDRIEIYLKQKIK